MDTQLAPRLLQLWSLTMVAFGLAITTIPWIRTTLFPWMSGADTDDGAALTAVQQDYLTFNQTLMGALTAGLGLAVFWLAREAVTRGERWGWTAIVTSVGLWFVVDSAASIATGFARNAVCNVVLVAPLVPLLWFTRPTDRVPGRVTEVSADRTDRPYPVHTGDTSSP